MMEEAGYTVVDWLSAGLSICTVFISFLGYLYFKAKLKIKSLKGENDGLKNTIKIREDAFHELTVKNDNPLKDYSKLKEGHTIHEVRVIGAKPIGGRMMKDTRDERITQLYEKALTAMKQYSSCEEYLSAEPDVHKPITLTHLSSFIRTLQHRINEYDCCIDDIERAKVGTEILYWCRSIGQYDCVEEEEK